MAKCVGALKQVDIGKARKMVDIVDGQIVDFKVNYSTE